MNAEENMRAVALELLLEIMEQGAFLHLVLNAALEKYAYLPKHKRAFLARLVKGTVERTIELDYLLNQVSTTKTEKMKPPIRNILRMGAYQLKYMDSVPDAAACNEAVRLAAEKGFPGLKGFVNGVMRNLARRLPDIPYPDRETQPVKCLSVRYSLPEWLVEKWCADYGNGRTEQMAAAFFVETPTAIRVNTRLTTAEELTKMLIKRGITVTSAPLQELCAACGVCAPDSAASSAHAGIGMPVGACAPDSAASPVQAGMGAAACSNALFLSGYDSLRRIPEFRDGLFYVQDLTSQVAAFLLAPRRGAHILDVCAAPGGKALHAAELVGETGEVVARDLTLQKINLLEENILRVKAGNVVAERFDAAVLDESRIGWADAVIADLPCSGLGVTAKKADIRHKASFQGCKELAKLQRQILDTVWRYVRPGGRLLYSTCTVCREENEENAAWFVNAHPEFEPVVTHQFFPETGKWDGFFYALFQRKA